jgi:hypothetical protein
MKEEYVSNGLARKLLAKGCPLDRVCKTDEGRPLFYELPLVHPEWQDCDAWYAPTIAQVLGWLREEKRLHVEFISAAYGYTFIISKVPSRGGSDIYHARNHGPNDGGAWDNYEDCAKASVEYILDNLV